MLRGCASGESGTPKASTQLAPKEAISHGAPDMTLSQPVAPMAITTPINDVRVKRSEGAAGAPDLSRRRVDMEALATSVEVTKGYRSVYLQVNRSVYTVLYAIGGQRQ